MVGVGIIKGSQQRNDGVCHRIWRKAIRHINHGRLTVSQTRSVTLNAGNQNVKLWLRNWKSRLSCRRHPMRISLIKLEQSQTDNQSETDLLLLLSTPLRKFASTGLLCWITFFCKCMSRARYVILTRALFWDSGLIMSKLSPFLFCLCGPELNVRMARHAWCVGSGGMQRLHDNSQSSSSRAFLPNLEKVALSAQFGGKTKTSSFLPSFSLWTELMRRFKRSQNKLKRAATIFTQPRFFAGLLQSIILKLAASASASSKCVMKTNQDGCGRNEYDLSPLSPLSPLPLASSSLRRSSLRI
jgi:hypothetical protein